MATYYNGNSELQGGDGLQTLVLMNPGYVYYPDSQQSTQPQPGNFMFLDSNLPGNNPVNQQHHQHQHQHHQANMAVAAAPPPPAQTQLVGVPLSAASPQSSHNAFISRGQYIYSPVEMAPPAQRDATPFQQGLSLTLSSQQSRYVSQARDTYRDGGITGAGGGGGSTSSASGVSNNVSGMHNVLLNSKYLKATQEILEEVVNVGKAALKSADQPTKDLKVAGGDPSDRGSPPAVTRDGETITKSGTTAELTTAERQELQMKKAKLVNMLDEVEQRYRQYHHQMQLVITWFEQAAGIGSAKTYTALALQTISKQFRSLKDTIIAQIKAASVSLGEDDSKADGSGSRLKFVDNQLRQQRALQQLGMIQQNAWRPQRGLPERSVSVLRAWLFEHFLHPYPKDSDKHMLAKQTGLTRSQVSNWFINARVRLWKPMVEEMYLEEMKEHEQNGTEDNKPNTNTNTIDKQNSSPETRVSPENSNREFRTHPSHPPVSTAVSPPPTGPGLNFHNQTGFSLVGTLETERNHLTGITQFSPKKPRNEPNQQEQQTQDTSVGFTLTGANPTDFIGGYPIGEIGRFTAEQFHQHYSGNGVSLTLGLPHGENLSIAGSHQSYLPNYTEMNPPAASHTAAMYESINIQNRKRFAAQPLPDFVA